MAIVAPGQTWKKENEWDDKTWRLVSLREDKETVTETWILVPETCRPDQKDQSQKAKEGQEKKRATAEKKQKTAQKKQKKKIT